MTGGGLKSEGNQASIFTKMVENGRFSCNSGVSEGGNSFSLP
jgi:hypothetical protein